jgi:erythronate-4-phosphate dehydrogenase
MTVVVVDVKNPFLAEALAEGCEVRALPTAEITRPALLDADAVVVRSETRVDAALLEGTRVRFVGTATIGIDHVDVPYLSNRGIGFASAPGSNANSVAEYFATALLDMGGRLGIELRGLTLGVVGVGNVGSRVAKVGEALGMHVLLNDPPLERLTGDPRYRPLDELMDADILSLHVPLTRSGADATYHLWDAGRMRGMKAGSILVNTSRGGVVETQSLHRALTQGHLRAAVLDVWEHEPGIDAALLAEALIATPHIAGYSFDGKVNAARIMFEALSAHFALGLLWPAPESLPPPRCPEITLRPGGRDEDILRGILTRCYDIEEDVARLKATVTMETIVRGAEFRRFRAEYPVRREFAATVVRCGEPQHALCPTLAALGFRCGSATKDRHP